MRFDGRVYRNRVRINIHQSPRGVSMRKSVLAFHCLVFGESAREEFPQKLPDDYMARDILRNMLGRDRFGG